MLSGFAEICPILWRWDKCGSGQWAGLHLKGVLLPDPSFRNDCHFRPDYFCPPPTSSYPPTVLQPHFPAASNSVAATIETSLQPPPVLTLLMNLLKVHKALP